MPVHALVTGESISGRIPVSHPDIPAGHIDVTPDTIYFEHDDETASPPVLLAVADAIEDEHYVRKTHPVDAACTALNDPDQYDQNDPAVQALKVVHQAEHQALHAKMADRKVTR
jgi:hypothetical protein